MILEKKLNIFQKNIGYKFNDLSILSQSLIHPSYYKSIKTKQKSFSQFERFEFLGDRVLGLIIASLLVKKFKKLNEGDLSKKYSYLVQRNFLYKISNDLLINEILLYNFKKNNSKMLVSIFSDTVESLIGAIFIDGGYNSAYNFVKKYWSSYLNIKISKTLDAKTTLQELSQQKSKKLPEYKLIKREGPSHSPIFTISLKVLNLKKIESFGSSIREAETKAAKKALNIINEKKIIKN